MAACWRLVTGVAMAIYAATVAALALS